MIVIANFAICFEIYLINAMENKFRDKKNKGNLINTLIYVIFIFLQKDFKIENRIC